MKDQFLATVSHELRTPLNAILGWSDMLRSGDPARTAPGRRREAIFHNAQRQARLIDELLDMARIMSGKLRLERALGRAARRSSAVRSKPCSRRPTPSGITSRSDLDPAIGAFYGDGAGLQQVMWNLLSNAVKFTPEGGAVHVRVRRRGDVGEMIVADSRCRASRGTFCRRSSSPSARPTDRRRGCTTDSGSGSRFVKHLVEAHGGSVVVESAGEGLGAVFTVRLPLASLDCLAPELAGPSGHETLAGPGRDVLEQAPLERFGLLRQSQLRETLHDAREPQMVVIAGMQPDAPPRLEPRGVDLDPAASAPSSRRKP